MRKLSASAGLGLGRTEPLKLGLGGGGKESALKAVVKQLEETLKAKEGHPVGAPPSDEESSELSDDDSFELGGSRSD